MPGTRRRAALLAPTLLVAAGALSGCVATTNFDAQTDQVYTPADGVNDRSGGVDVLNVLVLTDSPGTGRLIAGISNGDATEEDRLTGVRGGDESPGLTVSLLSGDTTLPPAGFLDLSDDDAPMIVVSGEEVRPGGLVDVVFSFERGQEVEILAPVFSPEDIEYYQGIELPTGSPTATPAG